jgi:hypothetical protein
VIFMHEAAHCLTHLQLLASMLAFDLSILAIPFFCFLSDSTDGSPNFFLFLCPHATLEPDVHLHFHELQVREGMRRRK